MTMRALVLLVVAFVGLATAQPSAAQQYIMVNADPGIALDAQLQLAGVDPATATGEQLAAAIEALAANNPDMGIGGIQDLVLYATQKNPTAYRTIAMGGVRAANARGASETQIADILGTAVGMASRSGVDTTGAAESLAQSAGQATGKQINSTTVANRAQAVIAAAYTLEAAVELYGAAVFLIDENPNQDASQS